ncbi:MAG: hypothetical protein HYV09_37265 [Deltaproteobacteria bacterium]|nr:hypothetical protein [Deltaproteobacteria bacterium]
MKRLAIFALVSAWAQAASAEECSQNRPTDGATAYGGYVYEGAAKSWATPEGNARVWWVETGAHAAPTFSSRTDGVPDVVAIVGEVLEQAVAGYQKLGFEPALRDGDYPSCASNGGDGRYDVYLVAFKGADGVTANERCTTVGTAQRCPGFMLVDRNFKARGYDSQREGAETVVAHEYFHMVQNAYDVGMDRWWAEGTAQWAVKQLYPANGDLERFLPSFFAESGRPIDTPPAGVTSGFLYGAAIWPVFLHQHRGKETVTSVMAALGAGKGPVLAATDGVLVGAGTSLADEFAAFATWNAATGSRASSGGYADAAKYPMVNVEEFPDGETAELSGITAGFASRYYRLADPSPRTITLTTDDTRLGGVAVPLEDGKVALSKAVPLPASVQGEAIVVLAGRSSKKTDVRWALRASVPVVEPPPQATGGDDDGGCTFTERAPHGAAASAAFVGVALLSALVRRARAPRPSRRR